VATSPLDGLDPTGAQTPEAFMRLLRQARAASGLSIVEIVERARQRGYDLDPIGLTGLLEQPTLPGWQTVTGVLTACGLGGMQIDRWMRVYHDLGAPPPIAPATPPTAVQEFIDEKPVSVPPLVLTTAPATRPRLGNRHFALAAGVLVVLIMVPLLWFTLSNDEPDTVAADATSAAPRVSNPAPEPAPSPTDQPVAMPLPTETAAPTAPAPTTTRPPTRTTAPPPPPPPPSPADPGVLRSGVVALTGSGGFDLDSGQTAGEQDIYRINGDTLGRMNRGLLEPVSGAPSKQACQAERGWETHVGNLQVGQWLCVRTSDGRYGRLNVTAVGDTLKLAYTVWT